ncbi:unnamed protein product [Choristocarpus tenellus]
MVERRNYRCNRWLIVVFALVFQDAFSWRHGMGRVGTVMLTKPGTTTDRVLSQEYKTLFEPAIRPILLRPESKPSKGLWLFEQPHEVRPFVRTFVRMAVYKLTEGSVLVYNPISPTEETLQAVIDEIGQPADHVVIPTNSFEHLVYVSGWTNRFPEATFWGLEGVELEGALRREDLTVEARTKEWRRDLDLALLEGSKVFRECFLLHRPTQTVFTMDSFNHITDKNILSPVSRMILQALGTFGRPSCSTKMFLWDRQRCQSAISRVLGWDFDLVLPTHGTCPIPDAKRVIKEEFSFLF